MVMAILAVGVHAGSAQAVVIDYDNYTAQSVGLSTACDTGAMGNTDMAVDNKYIYIYPTSGLTNVIRNRIKLLDIKTGLQVGSIGVPSTILAMRQRGDLGPMGLKLDSRGNLVFMMRVATATINSLRFFTVVNPQSATPVIQMRPQSSSFSNFSGTNDFLIDKADNIYAFASVYLTGGGYSTVLNKLAPDGTLTRIAGTTSNQPADPAYAGPATQTALGRVASFVVDSQGSVYLYEDLTPASMVRTFVVRKIDGFGNIQTIYQGGGSGNIDPAGNIIVTYNGSAALLNLQSGTIIPMDSAMRAYYFSSMGGPSVFDSKGNRYNKADCGDRIQKLFPADKIAEYFKPDVSLKAMKAVARQPANIEMVFRASNAKIGTPITDLDKSYVNFTVDGINAIVPEAFFDIRPLKGVTASHQKVLMLDISSSITLADLASLKKAAKSVIVDATGKSLLLPNETVSVWTFDDVVTQRVGFTNNTNQLISAIDAIRIGGPSTNLYGAVVTGMNAMNVGYANKHLNTGSMILITDGRDTTFASTLSAAKSAIGANALYAIGVGSFVDQVTLKSLAGAGNYVAATNFAAIETYTAKARKRMQRISESFYLMEYTTPIRGAGTHTGTLSIKNNLAPDVINVYFDAAALGFTNPVPELIIYGNQAVAPGGSIQLEGVTKFVRHDPLAHTWTIDKPALATITVDPLDHSLVTLTAKPGASGVVTITLHDIIYPALSATSAIFIGVPSATPQISLGLNQTSFATGNTMTVTATVAAGTTPTPADVYVARQLPNGTLLFWQSNGTYSTALNPVVANIQVPNWSGTIYTHIFNGTEPRGSYTWFAALTQTGTLNVIGTMAVQPYTVGP